MSAIDSALSGLRAAEARVAKSAHNVANLRTPDVRPLRVVQTAAPGGGVQTRTRLGDVGEAVNLAHELVDQMLAATDFQASLRVLETDLEMRGSLLDILA